MGRRGPLPKPTALKEAQGNPGRRKLKANEPKPPSGDPLPPAWLTKRGRAIWDELAPAMIVMKTLTIVDRLSFGRFCDLFGRWLELKELRDKAGVNGWAWKAKSGHVSVLPQGAEERQLVIELRLLEATFGLNPAARARLADDLGTGATPTHAANPGAEGAEDPMAFFRGGGKSKDPPPLVG